MAIKYFLFSKEQMDIRIKTDEKIGKKYFPGKVVVKGKDRLFTEISDTAESAKYKDSKVVLKEEETKAKFKEPYSE